MIPPWRTVRVEIEDRADWNATIEIARVPQHHGLPMWIWTVARYSTLFGPLGEPDNLRDIKK